MNVVLYEAEFVCLRVSYLDVLTCCVSRQLTTKSTTTKGIYKMTCYVSSGVLILSLSVPVQLTAWEDSSHK